MVKKNPRVNPNHVAIIMDGNGRWAKSRGRPRMVGHRTGLFAVRRTVEYCLKHGVGYLTLFAFSSENWSRPDQEVSFLKKLFYRALSLETQKLKDNNVRLRLIGDLSAFPESIQQLAIKAENETAHCNGLILSVALNYGGQWDIAQAVQKLINNNTISNSDIRSIEQGIRAELSMNYAPDPDLFIRTGGEQRISNFLLWQLAYTELFFSETYWPDFSGEDLDLAFAAYRVRERRFGNVPS